MSTEMTDKAYKRMIRKSETVKPRFADNVLFNNGIKSQKHLLGGTDKNGNYVLPKFVTLTFRNKNTYHKEGTNGVVCQIDCYLNFDLPDYLSWADLFNDTRFTVKEVALCSDDDEFDYEKGKLIAQAKAEKEAYRVAKAMCQTIQDQLATIAEALNSPIAKFDEYAEHNDKFIDKVLDGEIKPRY